MTPTPIVPAMKPSASPEREALILALDLLREAEGKIRRETAPSMHEAWSGSLCDRIPAFIAQVEAAGFRRDPGWIACSERMPDDGAVVLAYCPRGEPGSYRMTTTSRWSCPRHWTNIAADQHQPTHWMPMPLPPAPDDNEAPHV